MKDMSTSHNTFDVFKFLFGTDFLCFALIFRSAKPIKNQKSKIKNCLRIVLICCMVTVLPVSCVKDLLTREHTTQLTSEVYWKTVEDAENGLHGVYAAVRGCFDRDYLFDGHAEYTRVRQSYVDAYDVSLSYAENLFNGAAYGNEGAWNPDAYGEFDAMYQFLYGGIHRANYVIDNVTEMLKTAKNRNDSTQLEIIIGEAQFLRGMCYFRLITMWGDVPYFGETLKNPKEAENVERRPIGEIKDYIIKDFTDAAKILPNYWPLSEWGRATRPAAVALRGKVYLYWASWKKNGWPELAGFTQSSEEATEAYSLAAADFLDVINNYDLTLYMDGAPGECDELGRADKLPNYYHLFTSKSNGASEFIFVFNHAGPRSNYRNQGEQLMRVFTTRGILNGQMGVMPNFEFADRYQLITTGEEAPALIPAPNTPNNTQYILENSSRNPQSYKDRDYRMKASMIWDFEVQIGYDSEYFAKGFVPWLFGVASMTIDQSLVNSNAYYHFTNFNVGQITNEGPFSQARTGYAFRKFTRNDNPSTVLYRNEGLFNWPVIRLADVYLMYAEADNELNGPQQFAIDLVDKIRARGALPLLKADRKADKVEFFNAIEQERIVELVAEGHRCFDIRRWRALERIFGEHNTPSEYFKDVSGANYGRFFHNFPELRYQRNYICRIPQKERDRNLSLTQNTPWR